MMRVEILRLDPMSATVRVTDDTDGVHVIFDCGARDKAHEALSLMIRNAARLIAEKKTEKEMLAFSKGPRQ